MHVGALPGRSRGLQGPPSASLGACFERKCALPQAEISCAGWSGWTRPPTMARGGVGGPALRLDASARKALKAEAANKVCIAVVILGGSGGLSK